MRMWWIYVAGFLLRLICSRGDLWLDEIWTIQLASAASSPLDIFDSLHHDNNHHLNTLVAYFLNGTDELWLYRLGPALAGSLATVVAAKCGRSARESLTLAILFAFSFLFVFYSSEARGYAYVMLAAVTAYFVFTREMRPALKVPLFTIVCVLGFLSHLTFLYAFVGFACAGIASAIGRRTLRDLQLWVTVPTGLFLIAFWFVDIRHLQIGGDQPSALLANLFDTAGLLLGLRFGYIAGLIAFVALTGAIAWGLRSEQNRQDQAFFIVAILICPAVILFFRDQSYLSPRYFLVPAVFAMMLFARALSQLPRKAFAPILFAFVALNTYAVVKQTADSRGHYAEAMNYICSAGRGKAIGGDHDARVGLVASFYAEKTESCRGFAYIPMSGMLQRPPDWLILYSLDRNKDAPNVITPEGLGTYKFARAFHSGELSGWTWWTFQRER